MAKVFLSSMNQLAREIERSSRESARDKVKAIREAERELKAQQRAMVADFKERQRMYVESQIAESESRNDEVEQAINTLGRLLVDAIGIQTRIQFDQLLVKADVPTLELGKLSRAKQVPQQCAIQKPSALLVWLPWIRDAYNKKVKEYARDFERTLVDYKKFENDRLKEVDQLTAAHNLEVMAAEKKAKDYNAQIRAWESAFHAGKPQAVADYFIAVLENSDYPEGFSQQSSIVYVPDSKQLVVEYDMPLMIDVIPSQKSFKYIKASDTITSTGRPEYQRRILYASVIAQAAIRSLHELFTADSSGVVDTIVFNGMVDTIDPGTGLAVRPCVVSVRTTRDSFLSLDLRHVEAIACLRTLKASFSKSPSELAPVRPVLELNMVDPRFVQETDVLSTLDQRLNLMDLNPIDFESLIANLFQCMGLETKLTQASRDGGVDCVAFDPRPIFGGKVVIQAKRYKNTVGVSAVRDLFGTMQNEGASKGILVTTSGYGKAAFDFANGKPMELLDGGNLLYLLKEHANLEAKIVMPDDWEGID